MGNEIKSSGEDGRALQITKPARSAALVEENNEGDATYRADVRVYTFDDLLLVVDRDTDRVKDVAVAELVASAARDTGSVYRAGHSSVTIAGNGYQVQLPNAQDAGFYVDTETRVSTAPGVLVIYRDRSARLAEDLVSIRRDQVETRMNDE